MQINLLPMERFWSKVDKTDSCWNWIACKDKLGYGRFHYGSRTQHVLSHRFAYELIKGNIPEGLELDHLCRNSSCVNPEHLEAVTHQVNNSRGDYKNTVLKHRLRIFCERGHPYSIKNTYMNNNHRYCRTCKRENMRKYTKQKVNKLHG